MAALVKSNISSVLILSSTMLFHIVYTGYYSLFFNRQLWCNREILKLELCVYIYIYGLGYRNAF